MGISRASAGVSRWLHMSNYGDHDMQLTAQRNAAQQSPAQNSIKDVKRSQKSLLAWTTR